MIIYLSQRKESWLFRALSAGSSLAFLATLMLPPGMAYAQAQPVSVLNLPVAGTMVLPTPGFAPALIKGLTVHPENPLAFDFIVDTGDSKLTGKALEDETSKLVRYFLATLTTPEENLWVNLSPYEKDRIIPDKFGETEMGRDLLAQDYILKQLMASMMYPEDGLGKEFWDRVYARAQKEFGTTKIPINTFNKIWIIPDEAVVVEYQGSAFVAKSHLKVMLEEDYLALAKNMDNKDFGIKGAPEDQVKNASSISSQVVKEILIPEIEKEVNQGKNFASLRQIYHSMILATWYKKNLKESLLSKVYVDKSKIKGVDVDDKEIKQKIYAQYVEAFKKGVYNYIKRDVDPATQKPIARKYFSGGFTAKDLSSSSVFHTIPVSSPAEVSQLSPSIRAGLTTSSPIVTAKTKLAEEKEISARPSHPRADELEKFVISEGQQEEWDRKIGFILGEAGKVFYEVKQKLEEAARAGASPQRDELLNQAHMMALYKSKIQLLEEAERTGDVGMSLTPAWILQRTTGHYLNNSYFIIGNYIFLKDIPSAQKRLADVEKFLSQLEKLKGVYSGWVYKGRGSVDFDATFGKFYVPSSPVSSPSNKPYNEILGIGHPVPRVVIVKSFEELFVKWRENIESGNMEQAKDAAGKIQQLCETPEVRDMAYNALYDTVLISKSESVVKAAQEILVDLPIYRKKFNQPAREAFLRLVQDLQLDEGDLGGRAGARRVQILAPGSNKGATVAVYYGSVPGFAFLYDHLEAELKKEIEINGKNESDWISDQRFEEIVQRVLAEDEYFSAVRHVLSEEAGRAREGRIAFERFIEDVKSSNRQFHFSQSTEDIASRFGYRVDFLRIYYEFLQHVPVELRTWKEGNKEKVLEIAAKVLLDEEKYEKLENQAIDAVAKASVNKAWGRDAGVSNLFQELLDAGPWQTDKTTRILVAILRGKIGVVVQEGKVFDDVITGEMLKKLSDNLIQAHQWEWMEVLVEEILRMGDPDYFVFEYKGLDDFLFGLIFQLDKIRRIANFEQMRRNLGTWRDGVSVLPVNAKDNSARGAGQGENGNETGKAKVIELAGARERRAQRKGPLSSPAEGKSLNVMLIMKPGFLRISVHGRLAYSQGHVVEVADSRRSALNWIKRMKAGEKPDVIVDYLRGEPEPQRDFIDQLAKYRNGDGGKAWEKKAIKVIVVSPGENLLSGNFEGIDIETITPSNDIEAEKILGKKISGYMNQPSSSPGGIDLDPSLMNLQIKRDKNWVPLPMSEQPPLEQMNIEGFYPVIINVTPLPALPILFGLDVAPADNPVGKVPGKQNLSWLDEKRTMGVPTQRIYS